jgi:large subunit ribosomal protein L21
MYAVIETGGKQYRVEVGTELEVDRLEVEAGQSITIDRVLLVADGGEAAIGRPLVLDAVVSAEVLRQDLADKVISFKYRPKARRRVKKGHRQELTVLRVTDVRLGDRSAAEEARKAEALRQTERQRLEEAAARQAAADAELAARLASQKPAPAEAPPGRRGRGRSGAAPDKTVAAAKPGKAAKPGQAEKSGTTAKPAKGSKAGASDAAGGRSAGRAASKAPAKPEGGRGGAAGKTRAAENERPRRSKKES